MVRVMISLLYVVPLGLLKMMDFVDRIFLTDVYMERCV
jgi:hypothetical protein